MMIFKRKKNCGGRLHICCGYFAEKIDGKGERQKPRKAWKRGMARSFAKRTFEYKCVMFNNNNFISTDILKP